MITNLANVTLVVKDYDEATRWYTGVLGLELRMDGSMGGDYRFVTVGREGARRRIHRAAQVLGRRFRASQQRPWAALSLRRL